MSFPEFLYRYRSADTKHFEEEIRRAFYKREIYCSPISEMNDPLDSKPVIEDSTVKEVAGLFRSNKIQLVSDKALADLGATKREITNYRKKSPFKKSPFQNAHIAVATSKLLIKRFRSRVMMASMSEVWDSTLMWSHYTKSHTGICIKYKPKILEFVNPLEHPSKVAYKENRSVLSTADMVLFATAHNAARKKIVIDREKISNALIYEKSSDWMYEKEWRVALSERVARGYYRFLPLEPVGVILGVNLSEKTEKMIRDIVPDHAEITRLTIHPTEYKLVVAE